MILKVLLCQKPRQKVVPSTSLDQLKAPFHLKCDKDIYEVIIQLLEDFSCFHIVDHAVLGVVCGLAARFKENGALVASLQYLFHRLLLTYQLSVVLP